MKADFKNAREVGESTFLSYYNKKKTQDPKFRVRDVFPVDVEEILKDLGWKLQSSKSLGDDIFDQTVCGKSNFEAKKVFFSEGSAEKPAFRFTLAHELGHVSLHENLNLDSLNRTRSKRKRNAQSFSVSQTFNAVEREADVFASSLLMPRNSVIRFVNTFIGQCPVEFHSDEGQLIFGMNQIDKKSAANKLADYSTKEGTMRQFFGVSKDAMSRRILELKLISDRLA